MGAIGAPFAKTFCGKNILADSLTAPVIDGEPGFDGAILRYLRVKAKLSIGQAAFKAGLSRPQLGNIEKGRRRVSTTLRNKLLGLYGYSPSSYRNFTTEDKRAKNIPIRFKLDILIAQMSDEMTEKVFAFALQNSNQTNQ